MRQNVYFKKCRELVHFRFQVKMMLHGTIYDDDVSRVWSHILSILFERACNFVSRSHSVLGWKVLSLGRGRSGYEIKERENGSGLIFLKNHWKSSPKFSMVALSVTGFAVLKSPWIVGRVLEKALILFFLETSLHFCASPWKVLEL